MNDRFKFRFYDKQCKMYLSDGHYINGDKWMDDYYEDVYDLPENIIPEQCTGLKDKNGNLIYEGDLLGGLPVVWVNELNGFRVKINTIHGWDWHYMNEFTNREITGNIHEQAEQKDVK